MQLLKNKCSDERWPLKRGGQNIFVCRFDPKNGYVETSQQPASEFKYTAQSSSIKKSVYKTLFSMRGAPTFQKMIKEKGKSQAEDMIPHLKSSCLSVYFKFLIFLTFHIFKREYIEQGTYADLIHLKRYLTQYFGILSVLNLPYQDLRV